MGRRPTILETFSFLADHYNSNFMGVDVNGRTSDLVDASYRHPSFYCFLILCSRDKFFLTIRKGLLIPTIKRQAALVCYIHTKMLHYIKTYFDTKLNLQL